jgi:hypothetical protein
MQAAEVMGTVENGAVRLDEALPFPDQTRVKLRVEPAWNAARALQVWEALLARIDERPIVAPGGPYRREELYDRH